MIINVTSTTIIATVIKTRAHKTNKWTNERSNKQTKINTTRKLTNKPNKQISVEQIRHATNSRHIIPTGDLASRFDVPVTQLLPVQPVEHWHLSGATQDPRLLSHPCEQIAVK